MTIQKLFDLLVFQEKITIEQAFAMAVENGMRMSVRSGNCFISDGDFYIKCVETPSGRYEYSIGRES